MHVWKNWKSWKCLLFIHFISLEVISFPVSFSLSSSMSFPYLCSTQVHPIQRIFVCLFVLFCFVFNHKTLSHCCLLTFGFYSTFLYNQGNYASGATSTKSASLWFEGRGRCPHINCIQTLEWGEKQRNLR